MGMLRDRIGREVLEKLYVRQRLTQMEIAERFGVSQSGIHKLLRQYGLPTKYNKRR